MKDLDIPRHHTLLPVLGGLLSRQRRVLRAASASATGAVRTGVGRSADLNRRPRTWRRILRAIRNQIMPWELAFCLKLRGYDIVWTQWPLMDNYGITFWRACRLLGMRLVHTVHNVLPHEDSEKDKNSVGRVYQCSDTLFVHSEYSRRELLNHFPLCEGKVINMRFGLYTMYPKSEGGFAEVRKLIEFARGRRILLSYGSVRPYKNLDSVLHALRAREDVVLVIAGRESAYSDLVPGDPLGRMRRIATNLGILDRVQLIPGMLDHKSTADLFAAVDALILPYLKSYGSGALLLGMTFGLHVIASKTGGMDEYLRGYPSHTLLSGTDASSISEGITAALNSINIHARKPKSVLPHLDWQIIGKQALLDLQAGLLEQPMVRM